MDKCDRLWISVIGSIQLYPALFSSIQLYSALFAWPGSYPHIPALIVKVSTAFSTGLDRFLQVSTAFSTGLDRFLHDPDRFFSMIRIGFFL